MESEYCKEWKKLNDDFLKDKRMSYIDHGDEVYKTFEIKHGDASRLLLSGDTFKWLLYNKSYQELVNQSEIFLVSTPDISDSMTLYNMEKLLSLAGEISPDEEVFDDSIYDVASFCHDNKENTEKVIQVVCGNYIKDACKYAIIFDSFLNLYMKYNSKCNVHNVTH